MKHVFNISALIEMLTGVALLATPALIVDLLLGAELDVVATLLARIAGIGLLSLGICAWERPQDAGARPPRIGILVYNVGAAVILVVAGTASGMAGLLLWPAVGLHALLGMAMIVALAR